MRVRYIHGMEAVDLFYIPKAFIGERVQLTLTDPIASIPVKNPQGQTGIQHIALGITGHLREISPTSIVVAIEEDSVLGPPSTYAVTKKALLACGMMSRVQEAGITDDVKKRLGISTR